jgi:SAM-dependent methyltransferase
VHFSEELVQRSGYDRDGFAAHYDRFRPRPPRALLETLLQVAGVERAALVVDLGTGTGLSARAWAGDAEQVVGIEPNPAMLEQARAATTAPNVEYRLGYSHETGLDDGRADIVTCSQSFHWMEPEPTLAEAARILRPGGVFAAYDYDVVPVCDWRVEEAFEALLERRRAFRRSHGAPAGGDKVPKQGHLERITATGGFRFTREIVLHSVEEGSADRLIGLGRALGLPGLPMAPGGDELERELQYGEFEETVRKVLGDRMLPFRFGYRIRLGVV